MNREPNGVEPNFTGACRYGMLLTALAIAAAISVVVDLVAK